MRDHRTFEIGTGLFVLLGFAALLFLTTQLPTNGLKFGNFKAGYTISARFENRTVSQASRPRASWAASMLALAPGVQRAT